MDALDQENALLEQRIAQLEASLGSTPEPTGYSLKQAAFDIPVGITRGVAGLADIVSYPVVKGLEYAGAPVETFGATKLLDALIESNKGLEGPGVAEILGVRPKTEVQRAVEFMTPGPGGKGRLASEAGLGLTSYLGTRLGETVAPESPYAGLVGALVAPTLAQGAVSGATKLASALKPPAQIVLGNEEALRAAANQNVLQGIGKEGLERIAIANEIPSLGIGAGGVPLTAAEIAQTPQAAKFQSGFLNTPEGGDILQSALNARQAEVGAALERLGITPQQGEMSLLLRDAAETAAKQKEAQQSGLLTSLGLTDEAKAQTSMERGQALQESLMARKESVQDVAGKIWKETPKNTKLDASVPFAEAIDTFESFGKLTKADTSSKAQRVMSEVYDIAKNKNGVLTVGELQDIRAAAGRAMADASGVNDAEVSLMRQLRESIDQAGLKYFYDPEAGALGGLPGTAATKPDLEALTKLSKAIEATRSAKQTFSQGVVGDLTAIRQFKPKVQTSRVMKKALEKTENVVELSDKFGFDSPEMTEVRTELLARLSNASNPTEYIGREKATFQAAFKDKYKDVESFAQKSGQKGELDEYLRMGDSAIPNKIFADERSAAKFARQFADSPILQMGRAKFISERLQKRGNTLDNLTKNRAVAKKLFQDDLPELEKVLKDLEIAKSPAILEKQAASGNSLTSIRQTALGAITGARGVINAMRQGTLAGTLAGSGTMTGALIGYSVGNWVKKIGDARNSTMNAFESELLANPKLIKLASAPPTKSNIDALMKFGVQLGYFGGKSQTENVVGEETTQGAANVTNSQGDIESENLMLEQRILELEKSLTSVKEVKVGKQNISLPTGDDYAPADLVKAVIQVESAGKPNAVSNKGARGLMQLMPGTAKDLGVDATDPEENVEGGSRYLQQQIKEFGDKRLALAAYNWGPGNIKNAIAKIKADGKKPTWENIKQYVKVPRETREYVDRVLSLV